MAALKKRKKRKLNSAFARKAKRTKAAATGYARKLAAKKVAKRAKAIRTLKGNLRASLIRLDRQGYDSRGRYYGVGAPVYDVTEADTGERVAILRAKDSKSAKSDAADQLLNFKLRVRR